MRHFELDARPGHGTVRVDGTDISSSITGVTVEARVNAAPASPWTCGFSKPPDPTGKPKSSSPTRPGRH